ncbi:hypothetical protein EGW08_009592 [Elysia chlorotica]|uniref:NIPSNAP domain-containing protein n=1 Tax=Elysia chlorotica TaxID=188477 RepID=A0A3S0ZPD8_ELYCH|nr:hypothetical protein EGW08_009592 [Elysia chlorotica]
MCAKLLTTLMRGKTTKIIPSISCPKQQKLCSTEAASSSLYELRSYQAEPKDFKTLVDLFAAHIDKRTHYSKLLWFWTAEIGDNLWQVIHLWEYGSLQERAGVRKALAQDKAWASEFLSQSMPRMKLMKNYIVMPAPSTKLDTNFSYDDNAVYVLQTVNAADKLASMPKSVTEDEKLIGRFIPLLGPGNTEFRLWRYLNLNAVTEECLHRAKEHPTEGSSILLQPTAFSPLK